MKEEYLIHWGILGMKWGIRRYQNPDGTLTEAGKKRYYNTDGSLTNEGRRWKNDERQKRLAHPELMTDEEIETEIKRFTKENDLKRLIATHDKLVEEERLRNAPPPKPQKLSWKEKKLAKKQAEENAAREKKKQEITDLELDIKKQDLIDQKNKKGKYAQKKEPSEFEKATLRIGEEAAKKYIKETKADNLFRFGKKDKRSESEKRVDEWKKWDSMSKVPEYMTTEEKQQYIKDQKLNDQIREMKKKEAKHSGILIHHGTKGQKCGSENIRMKMEHYY